MTAVALLMMWAQVFTPVSPERAEAFRFGAALPAFEAKDALGRIWRLEDLRGKYTLVYLWHTFAARQSDAAEVLTFCTDYDYTHAGEYMKEREYSFPVIADWELARKLFGTSATQLVVSPEGRVSEPVRSWSFSRLRWETQRLATASVRRE
jgi:hypothetical protein